MKPCSSDYLRPNYYVEKYVVKSKKLYKGLANILWLLMVDIDVMLRLSNG